jgi:hypothetical protein
MPNPNDNDHLTLFHQHQIIISFSLSLSLVGLRSHLQSLIKRHVAMFPMVGDATW